MADRDEREERVVREHARGEDRDREAVADEVGDRDQIVDLIGDRPLRAGGGERAVVGDPDAPLGRHLGERLVLQRDQVESRRATPTGARAGRRPASPPATAGSAQARERACGRPTNARSSSPSRTPSAWLALPPWRTSIVTPGAWPGTRR